MTALYSLVLIHGRDAISECSEWCMAYETCASTILILRFLILDEVRCMSA